MTIKVNGKTLPLESETNLERLLSELSLLQPHGIAVAVNNEVIPRKEWSGYPVRDGSSIEIVAAVAGG